MTTNSNLDPNTPQGAAAHVTSDEGFYGCDDPPDDSALDTPPDDDPPEDAWIDQMYEDRYADMEQY